MRARLGLIAWCGVLAGSLWFLLSIGGGDLATPPPPWRWQPWLERVDAAAAVVALLRMVGIAAAWYLALATVVGALGRRSGAKGLVTVTDRVTPGFVRVLLGSTGALTLSAAGLTVAVTPLLAPGDVAGMGGVGAAPAIGVLRAVEVDTDAPPAEATLRPVNPAIDPGPPVGDARAILRPYLFEFAPFTTGVVDAPEGEDEWIAQSGDHFWHIAADTLSDRWRRTPEEAEVALFWTRVVEHNRARLVVPSNPDLIYPGQVFSLPEVPSDPRS